MNNNAVQSEEACHMSGSLHARGESEFVCDMLMPKNRLIAKPVFSSEAHAEIVQIDKSKALSLSGVVAVFTASDIPGKNNIGHFGDIEPLLPAKEVVYVGQPVALVVAENDEIAAKAAKLVEISYKKLAPVFTIDHAVRLQQFYIPMRKIERGDIELGFKESDYVLEGEVQTGAQEHWYFETQSALCVPEEDNYLILYSATQNPATVQHEVACVLGLESNAITVDVKRLGGGFGGKEEGATIWACLAALASFHTKKPVFIKLSRLEDHSYTGKRHPFKGIYKIGFNKNGKIIAYDITLYSNGGALADISIPVLERAMLFAASSYYIPNVRVRGAACRTNLPLNTAMRGFGAPQSVFITESAVTVCAKRLKMDPLQFREINMFREGETTPCEQPVCDAVLPQMTSMLKEKSSYEKLRAEVDEFNRANCCKKRGLGFVPVTFGLSFTQTSLNQGSALVWVYTDGSISVSHGGIEMGQQLNTKVAQVVAKAFGVPLSYVRVESTNTKRVANMPATAASTGADLNCNAAWNAAMIIRERLAGLAATVFNAKNDEIEFVEGEVRVAYSKEKILTFAELAMKAFHHAVSLGAYGFYHTPGVKFNRETGRGTPYYYFVQGVALSEVEIDILTGEHVLRKVYIVHDAARPINRLIDRGQIYGAFMQGYGLCVLESLNPDANGRYMENTLSTYKIPTVRNLPEVFDVTIYEHDCKVASILGSKGVGEPPLLYGESVFFAIKDAIEAIGNHEKEIYLKFPAIPENVLSAIEDIK